MKLCLIGDFSGTPDEGMKNVSRSTYEYLASRHDVMVLTSRTIVNPWNVKRVMAFRPDIIHYLHGPTIRSLILLFFVKWITGGRAKTVVSATRPYFSKMTRPLVSLLKPDLVLTQSERFERFFRDYGCQVAFLPNGVDCRKFHPVDAATKAKLRDKFGIPKDKTVVLHVGHFKKNRKLDLFTDIQAMDHIQVVIVGGTVETSDEALKDKLMAAGVRVIHHYIEDISEIYQAADLYLFPISDKINGLPESYNQIGAIDLPLSVLEAMACNLPVISSPFGALPRLFNPGNGLVFCDSEMEMKEKILHMDRRFVKTRDAVLPLDWQRIIGDLESRYMLLREGDDVSPAVSDTHHLKGRPQDERKSSETV